MPPGESVPSGESSDDTRDSFVVEDDGDADIPIEFGMARHQDLSVHFKSEFDGFSRLHDFLIFLCLRRVSVLRVLSHLRAFKATRTHQKNEERPVIKMTFVVFLLTQRNRSRVLPGYVRFASQVVWLP